MLGIFEKRKCALCNEKYERKTGVKCEHKHFCSVRCAVGYLLDITPEELKHIDLSIFNPEKNICGITVKGEKMT